MSARLMYGLECFDLITHPLRDRLHRPLAHDMPLQIDLKLAYKTFYELASTFVHVLSLSPLDVISRYTGAAYSTDGAC